jgi:DNA-binding phage protein
MDVEIVAREFLTAIRGRRSQVAWSRRLGYRSNVAYTWEAGRRYPTIAETFRAIERSGLDLRGGLVRFHGNETPGWLVAHEDLATVEATAAFLRTLKGRTPTTEIARQAGLSRYAVTRWLSGQTQPRLPDFLTFLEAASLRLVDFVTSFVPPEQVPAVLPMWRRLEARRAGAGRHPWTQAVLRCLEVADYLALPRHEEGWIARRLGIPREEELRCMEHLLLTGQIEQDAGRYRAVPLAVDTRRSPGLGQTLKAHWARVGVERIEAGAPGQFSYNVFTCSAADFERIRAAHLAYYQTLRQIVAGSAPDEHVVVANVQLFQLDPDA